MESPASNQVSNKGKAFFTPFTVCVLIFNIIIIAKALEERGWGAYGLLLLIGPAFNGICMAAGAVAVLVINRRLSPEGAPGTYWLLAFMLPLVCAAIDLFILFSGITGGGC